MPQVERRATLGSRIYGHIATLSAINPPISKHVTPLISRAITANPLGLSTTIAITLANNPAGGPKTMANPARALNGLPHPGWRTHITPNATQGASESPTASLPAVVRDSSANGEPVTSVGSERPEPGTLSDTIGQISSEHGYPTNYPGTTLPTSHLSFSPSRRTGWSRCEPCSNRCAIHRPHLRYTVSLSCRFKRRATPCLTLNDLWQFC